MMRDIRLLEGVAEDLAFPMMSSAVDTHSLIVFGGDFMLQLFLN